MNKIKKHFWIILSIVIIIGFILLFSFVLDVGINSKHFIKRDFNKAFHYRITGDCNAFLNYIYRDIDNWKETCENQKYNPTKGIREFKIQNISHQILSDRAFLQVELTRLSGKEDVSYSVNYEMRKDGFLWKIDQDYK